METEKPFLTALKSAKLRASGSTLSVKNEAFLTALQLTKKVEAENVENFSVCQAALISNFLKNCFSLQRCFSQRINVPMDDKKVMTSRQKGHDLISYLNR